VTLTRNGVDSNIINRLVAGSTWLTLREGQNTFHVEAVQNVKNYPCDLDAHECLFRSVKCRLKFMI